MYSHNVFFFHRIHTMYSSFILSKVLSHNPTHCFPILSNILSTNATHRLPMSHENLVNQSNTFSCWAKSFHVGWHLTKQCILFLWYNEVKQHMLMPSHILSSKAFFPNTTWRLFKQNHGIHCKVFPSKAFFPNAKRHILSSKATCNTVKWRLVKQSNM